MTVVPSSHHLDAAAALQPGSAYGVCYVALADMMQSQL